MLYFIEVVLPLAVSKTFTYQVSETEFKHLTVGMRVTVPFGKTKIYTALVLKKHHELPRLYQPKEIHQILDDSPIITTLQIKLWHWIAQYYMCSLGEVFRSALPTALILASETTVSLKKITEIKKNTISDEEYLVLEALEKQNTITLHEVSKIVNKKTIIPMVNKMLKKGIITLHEEIKETYKPKLIKYVKLNKKYETKNTLPELLELLSNAKKQRELLLHFFQLKATHKQKPISVKQLLTTSGISAAIVKALVDKEIFKVYYLQKDRVSFAKDTTKITLSDAQNKALQGIKNNLTNFDVTLLHGVTASGKTEVYCKLIEEVIAKGKQVLFLLPEIALTTQLVARLTAIFGNQVTVFHSKYSNNERVEAWNRILQQSEKAKIIIGVRSALFLPFSNLGLVIVDEEHEATFKQQEPAPRYHARDTAIVLAKQYNAKVVLGSATPSLETFYNVAIKKYGITSLKKRYGNVVLPEIELVDLKDKYFRKKMTGHFSDVLLKNIEETLAREEQVILFQNRRGFSSYIECLSCGNVPHCPSCDVSLTYYKFKKVLKCHYCGYTRANLIRCDACNSLEVTKKGFGTEQIEEELQQLFPDVKIGRMDQDTTRGKFGYEKIIDAFKNREYAILVGTQMLAKGLDFDAVTLVGVLNADNLLNQPHYRAFERTFQTLTQVAGRAGRKDKKGKVIIQTYTIHHNTIQQMVNSDFKGMYKEQIYERRNFKYPPFYRLIRITLKHKDFSKLKEAALWYYNVLKQIMPPKVLLLGPEEPPINRIRNQYIRTVVVKIPTAITLNMVKNNIIKTNSSFEAIAQYRSVRLTINVDF